MFAVMADTLFPGILLQMVGIMALDLLHAAYKRPAVAVFMHRCAFMMGMEYGAGLHLVIFFACDIPAMPGVLRLERDSVASGEFYSEVITVDALQILSREHGLFLLPHRFRRPCAFAVVY